MEIVIFRMWRITGRTRCGKCSVENQTNPENTDTTSGRTNMK